MLGTMIAIMSQWREVFSQRRTMCRAIRQAIASTSALGRRTIARAYLITGQSDWSGEYKLHSRSKWKSEDLFTPVLKEAMSEIDGDLLPFGTDDTRISKTGKKIKSARWGRDPQSPKFHLNLKWGIRYLHTSLLLPLHRFGISARALPVWFEEATPIKKPGKKATEEEKAAYGKAQKEHNLSLQAVAMFKSLRKKIDDLGYQSKTLVFALDGSFCNSNIFKAALERIIVIARTRKNAVLCFAANQGKKVYSDICFTPEAVRQDNQIAWKTTRIFHAGRFREIEYKELTNVLWRKGSGKKPLRLFVTRPTPYRKTLNSKTLYREPAYLLCTDLKTESRQLLQIYFDRWQVEVAHKEMKQDFGLGQAQVRVPASIKHQPALTAATYSIMHLTVIKNFGAHRPEEFEAVPKYQRDKSRASSQDLIRYFRLEVSRKPYLLPPGCKITADLLFAAAS
jgi:hypothetical protein